jgi:hypothetical protein
MQDETLKQSFLTAVLMLVGAISRSEGAHSYEFSQTSELLESLMVRARSPPLDQQPSQAEETPLPQTCSHPEPPAGEEWEVDF